MQLYVAIKAERQFGGKKWASKGKEGEPREVLVGMDVIRVKISL